MVNCKSNLFGYLQNGMNFDLSNDYNRFAIDKSRA